VLAMTVLSVGKRMAALAALEPNQPALTYEGKPQRI
jgi:hypothetical protein